MQFRSIFVLALGVLFAGSALASPRVYKYECVAMGDNSRGIEKFALKVAGPRAQLAYDGNKYEGTLDRDYNPRLNTNYYRYEGWSGLDQEWHSWLLIEKSLLKGGRTLKSGDLGGVVKIQARGEGYDSQSYGCTRE